MITRPKHAMLLRWTNRNRDDDETSIQCPLERRVDRGCIHLVVAALAVVVSALIGAGYSSTALVNGGPGSDPSKPLDVSSDSLNRYLDTELIYIGTLKSTMADNITAATG